MMDSDNIIEFYTDGDNLASGLLTVRFGKEISSLQVEVKSLGRNNPFVLTDKYDKKFERKFPNESELLAWLWSFHSQGFVIEENA